MSDSEFTMFVFLWIFGGIILFQWWRIHCYRNKIERIALGGMPTVKPELVSAVPQSTNPQRDEELERIKNRLQVLERIATDGSSRLDSEFHELRRA